MKNPPIICFSEMTGRWYIATRYEVLDEEGNIRATTKFDVTDSIGKILEKNFAIKLATLERRKSTTLKEQHDRRCALLLPHAGPCPLLPERASP